MKTLKQDQKFMKQFVTTKKALTYLRTKRGTIPKSRTTLDQLIEKGELDVVWLCDDFRLFYKKQLKAVAKRVKIRALKK